MRSTASMDDALRQAAERVVWFDWSDNDEDAVRAIADLRAALEALEAVDDLDALAPVPMALG